MQQNQDSFPMIVAVPAAAVTDLTQHGIATTLPDARGSVLDAVITVGTDAATVVALMQGPDTVGAFAEWIRGLFSRTGNSIRVVARRGDRRVKLSVDGDVPIEAVEKFLTEAFEDEGNL